MGTHFNKCPHCGGRTQCCCATCGVLDVGSSVPRSGVCTVCHGTGGEWETTESKPVNDQLSCVVFLVLALAAFVALSIVFG